MGSSRIFLILQETRFQDQVLKSSSLSKKQAEEVSVIKARQLASIELMKLFQPYGSTASRQMAIYRGLRKKDFIFYFLPIRDYVFGLSFLTTLDT